MSDHMNCRWVRNNLAAYIDAELPDGELSSVRQHVQDCSRCAFDHGRIVNAWEMLDVWEGSEPPVGLKQSVLAGIEKEKTSQWLNILLPAAAVLLLAIGIVLYSGSVTRKTDKDIIVQREEPALYVNRAIGDVNEEEIISNLQMLEDKEFYDSLEMLKMIDYLPLIEEPQGTLEDNKRSSLEYLFI